ncbi:hypothetical protein M405DRAFT_918544 [Rhizopogon salebrosus TDB-379]|nr:hypothetical protein M405DRAFT_918544 [Rhizopogon salebrosus TDB-379]
MFPSKSGIPTISSSGTTASTHAGTFLGCFGRAHSSSKSSTTAGASRGSPFIIRRLYAFSMMKHSPAMMAYRSASSGSTTDPELNLLG